MTEIREQYPKLGEVYYVNFEGHGSVQRGERPAVVFQNNTGNLHSPNVIVFPMTSRLKNVQQPTHVIIKAEKSGLSRDSMVLCENPVCIPKDLLGDYITVLSEDDISAIAEANLYASGSISYINPALLPNIFERASQLNSVH